MCEMAMAMRLMVFRRGTQSARQLFLLSEQMSVLSMRGVRWLFLYLLNVNEQTLSSTPCTWPPSLKALRLWSFCLQKVGYRTQLNWTYFTFVKFISLSFNHTTTEKLQESLSNMTLLKCSSILRLKILIVHNPRRGSKLWGLGSSHTIALGHCEGRKVITDNTLILIPVPQLDHILSVIIISALGGDRSSTIQTSGW